MIKKKSMIGDKNRNKITTSEAEKDIKLAGVVDDIKSLKADGYYPTLIKLYKEYIGSGMSKKKAYGDALRDTMEMRGMSNQENQYGTM